jgi:hypothetical protein
MHHNVYKSQLKTLFFKMRDDIDELIPVKADYLIIDFNLIYH